MQYPLLNITLLINVCFLIHIPASTATDILNSSPSLSHHVRQNEYHHGVGLRRLRRLSHRLLNRAHLQQVLRAQTADEGGLCVRYRQRLDGGHDAFDSARHAGSSVVSR